MTTSVVVSMATEAITPSGSYLRLLHSIEPRPYKSLSAMLRLACGIMSRTVQDGRRDIQLSRRRPYRRCLQLCEITAGARPSRLPS